MNNYLNGLTEEILYKNNIKSIKNISLDGINPRLIIIYNDDNELVVDSDDEIKLFLSNLK